MSMLSAQVDELRELAGDGSVEFVSGPIRASVLREAADTIWELRDDLQRANAENARLRSELDSVGTAAYLYGRSDIKAENAKLRELCVKALEWLRWAGGITCPPEVPDKFADELRELGIEVDG